MIEGKSGTAPRARAVTALVSLAVLLVALLGACGGSPPSSSGGSNQTVKIAGVWPLTGPFANNGKASLDGAQFAVKRINASGGVKALNGAKLEIVQVDTGSSAQTAVSGTSNALTDMAVVAGMGSWLSSYSLATTEAAQRARVPWISESFADEITGRGYNYLFDIQPPATSLGRLMWDDLSQMAKATNRTVKTIAVVGDNTAAAVPAQEALKTIATQNGIAVPVFDRWTPPLADASGLASKIQQAKVDAVLEIGYAYNDEVQLNQQLKSRGVTSMLMQLGGQSVIAQWQSVPQIAASMVGVVGYAPDKSNQTVTTQMAKDIGQPFVNQDNLTGYLQVYLIKEALEMAGKADREAVRSALSKLSVTSGTIADLSPTHHFQFDSSGRVKEPVAVAQQWQQTSNGFVPCAILPSNVALCKPQWPSA